MATAMAVALALAAVIATGPAATQATQADQVSLGTDPATTTPAPRAAKDRLLVGLRVGTTAYDGVGVSESLPARIEGIGLETLRSVGLVTAVHGDYTIDIVVAPLSDESSGYATTYRVSHRGEALGEGPRRVLCELCLEDELLSQIRLEITGLVPLIRGESGASPDAAGDLPGALLIEGPEPAEPLPVCPAPILREDPRRPGLGRLGVAGLVAVVGGAAAVGGGALGLWASADPGARDIRIPSVALLGVGGAAILSGVSLLMIDRGRGRSPRGRGFAVAPALSPRGAGLLGSLRF